MKKIIYGIVLVFCVLENFAQTPEINYLNNNKHEIKLNEKEKFGFLDNDFYSHQIFLFGENHGATQPHDFDILFFKHLYNKAKVRIYIAEIDQIKAKMLNNYLQDGNEEWLSKVFKSWKKDGAQWANKAHWNKYKQLRVFYQSLPKNEKFQIIGIDVIQDYSLVGDYFKILFKNNGSSIENINKFITTADTIQYKNRRILGQLGREISSEMKSDKRYSKELKENTSTFDLFIKNAGYTGNGMTRDSIMYRTYNDLVSNKNLKNEKMYGFLGFFHTLQCKYESMPFAGFLKRNQPNLKTVSLQILALNSTVLIPYNEQLKKIMPASFVNELRKKNPSFPMTEQYIPYVLSNDDPMMKVDGIEDLKSITAENTITFFKLTTKDTPYERSKKLAEVTGFQTLKMSSATDVTTNAFQYTILFRNSNAALPLN